MPLDAAGQDLEGVWSRAEFEEVSGPNEGRHESQPGLIIFTEGHYSLQFVPGTSPRRTLPDEATDAQIAAAFDPYISHGGTYEVNGSIIEFNRMVAKDPNSMRSEAQPFTLEILSLMPDRLVLRTPSGGSATYQRVE